MNGICVDALVRHLAACPPAFLADLHLGALVHDTVLAYGGIGVIRQEFFRKPSERRRQLIAIACWLLAEPSLRAGGGDAQRLAAWLGDGLDALARLVKPASCIEDDDRREELARLALAVLGHLPAGESAAQAEDRLRAVDSIQRAQVVAEMRAKEERARALRAKMAEEAAREAAAKGNREW